MGKLARLAVLAALALTGSAQAHPEPNDVDGDGVVNALDNCYDVRNGDQRDADRDGAGDKCDADADNDGHPNEPDNCDLIANPDQADARAPFGIGDACDGDTDGDGRFDYADNCVDLPNPDQRDNDRDATGDGCDPDDDDDGVFDTGDNCPLTYNWEQVDADRDGLGALCDADDTPKGLPGAPPPAPDGTAPRVTLSLATRHRLAAVRGGLIVGVRCSEACAVTAELRLDRKSARRAHLRRGVAIARGGAQVERAARTYAFLEFARSVPRKIRRAGRVTGTLQVTAVDRSGNRRRVRRAVRIVR
jgi:Thrombospondin type 3 repeat